MNSKVAKKLSRVDHTLPIFSPRTTYNTIRQNDENLLSDLTLNFDPFTINVLKNEFYIRNWAMGLVDFILVVKEHLLSWQIDIPNREQKLIRCLVNLFEEIDLNGNQILEWEELQNFIIEKATVLNQIKTKQDEIKQYTLSNIKLQQKFQQPITKVIYVPDIDRVAFYEEGSDKVYLMNHETGIVNKKFLSVEARPQRVMISSLKKEKDGEVKIVKEEKLIHKKTMILDMIYIKEKKYQVLITANNAKTVTAWRYTTNGFVMATQPGNEGDYLQHEFKHNIYCLAWDNVNELLYCGQKDGQINIWNLKNDTENYLKQDKDSHKKVIMSMIAMPKLQFLASAAMDGLIILWDTIKNTKKRKYSEHKRGILSLAFNESLILLFSAGFDHEFYVWNPYIGHASPLLGVIVVEGTSQIISIASDGYVKVWEIKKFNCVQNFSIETSDDKHKFNAQALAYIPRPLKLLISGRGISIYDYDKLYNPQSVDDQPAICAKFDPFQLCFITPHGNKLKIWNSLTGDIKKIYKDITQAEMTAFIFDNLCKRMIIGDANGETAVYNCLNGALIKKLPKHSAEVIKIAHIVSYKIPDLSYFVTASMDNTIKISDDSKINESDLIRLIQMQDVLVSSILFDPENKVIVTGTNNGMVAFIELDTGKYSGNYREIKDNEISSLSLIEDPEYKIIMAKVAAGQTKLIDKQGEKTVINKYLPYLICSTADGLINFITLPPIPYKYIKIHSFTNIDDETQLQVPIIQMVYCHETQKIFLIDDKGFLKCFYISNIIKVLKEVQHLKKPIDIHAKQQNLPQFKNCEPELIWKVKAHFEIMKSLEYIYEEQLIVTTAFDKKVKVWNSENGNFIDSLQQDYDKQDPKPIAYKRIGTSEIYSYDFEERIDQEFVQEKRMQQRMRGKLGKKQSQENQSEGDDNDEPEEIEEDESEGSDEDSKSQSDTKAKAKDKAITADQIVKNFKDKQKDDDKNEDNKPKNISQYQKSAKEEFDPLFDYRKIDENKIQNLHSNKWRLHIDFDKYYRQFEEKIQKTTQDVKIQEIKIQEQVNEEKIKKRFNVKNFQETKMPNYEDCKILQGDQVDTRKELELKKKKIENMKKIMDSSNKKFSDDQILKSMAPGIQEQLEGKNKIKSTYLYKKELKSKLVDQNTNSAKLTKEECEAAYKLAAALSNVDQEDYRVLKFLDVQIKKEKIEDKGRLEKPTNFIQKNKNTISDFTNNVKKLKEGLLKQQKE